MPETYSIRLSPSVVLRLARHVGDRTVAHWLIGGRLVAVIVSGRC